MPTIPIKAQELMILALNNGGITKDSQKVYSSRKFYNTVSFLKKNGFLFPVCKVCRSDISDENTNLCENKNGDHKKFKKENKFDNKKLYILTIKGELQAMVFNELKI